MQDVLLDVKAKQYCLKGGTHKETLCPQVQLKGQRVKSNRLLVTRVKADCFGLKKMLDCIDHEWNTKYMQQTTYTRRRISMEGKGTSRNDE